jgi:hypothetical protein
MPFQRLPETVQTLYAELLEQAIQAEAEAALLNAPQGTFVSKTVKGGTYWYLQRTEGDRRRQHYLGRESPSLLAWMEQVREARSGSAADGALRANLVSMLTAGGAATESAPVVKVLSLLAESGVFRMGGVLVGTQAFVSFGNMLGVRFDKQSLRTQDVDVAQDRAIGIALSQEVGAVDVQKSTSFKIRGRELRVDFLTPFDPECDEAVFLDYLIENPSQAVIVGGAGVLVNVPDPSRFAFHKLWVSTRRTVSEQTKAAKDLRQAGDLLAVLLADRPADVDRAWEAVLGRPPVVKAIRQAIRRLPPELAETLGSR